MNENVPIQQPTSERLTYRLLDADDGDLLFELDQDPAVMKHINGGKVTTKQEIRDTFIPRLSKYRNPDKGWGLWGVFLKPNQTFVGWVLVRPMHFFNNTPHWHDLELGWRFKQSSWGKGYGTEAAQAVVDAVKQSPEVTHLSAIAVPENQASLRIMEKLGMAYVKTDLHKDPLGDMTVAYYSMKVS